MFVRNYPAMVVRKNLVIADLHLGITKEFYDSGILLPQQSRTLADRVNMLKNKTRTKRLVILGDVKHKIPLISWQEYREVPGFFKNLDFSDIVITKGNHDGDIEHLLGETGKKIAVKKSFTAGNYAFTHGHANIKTKKKTIVIGHNHPKIMFKDAVGATYFEQVWIKGDVAYNSEKKHAIIMPPFNELAGSFVINDKKISDKDHARFAGPIAKNMKNHRVYMLDGTDLGHLRELKKDNRQ